MYADIRAQIGKSSNQKKYRTKSRSDFFPQFLPIRGRFLISFNPDELFLLIKISSLLKCDPGDDSVCEYFGLAGDPPNLGRGFEPPPPALLP